MAQTFWLLDKQDAAVVTTLTGLPNVVLRESSLRESSLDYVFSA